MMETSKNSTPSKGASEPHSSTGAAPTIKHILVPTDFSANATSALDYALSLAESFGADLTLLKARESRTRADMLIDMDKILERDDKTAMEGLLKGLRDRVGSETKLRTETLPGRASELIAAVARREHVDLIVMGTQGSSALANVYLGSTAAKVIRETAIPVIVVPSGTGSVRLDSIGLAIEDEKILDNVDLTVVQALVGKGEAEIVALHVGGETVLHHKAAIEKRFEGASVRMLSAEHDGNFERSLNALVVQSGIGLLCMARGQHTFFGDLLGKSATLQEVFSCPVPLLALRLREP